jgi:tRNA-2-methylthio-N6-dimethylallyladenosine synthase
VESLSRKEGYVLGRTDNHITVQFPGDASLIGKLMDIRITESRGFSLSGERLSTDENQG